MASRSARRRLLRSLCRLLRHDGDLFNLSLRADGFIDLDDLLAALNREKLFNGHLSRKQLVDYLSTDHDRFEVRRDAVRARYGHSHADLHLQASIEPPNTLYHGTSQAALRLITQAGLQPMGRRYLHLTSDYDYAWRVASRNGRPAAILAVDTDAAVKSGIAFHRASRHVWLSGPLPSEFLSPVDVRDRLPQDVDGRLAQLADLRTGSNELPTLSDGLRSYHVCTSCTAKWFAPSSRCLCPRCGRLSSSRERIVPPWAAAPS